MFKKYLKILFLFGKVSLMQQLAYRPSFILAVIGKILRIGIILIFFQAIYFNIKSIAGWSFEQILFLTATFFTIEFIMSVTFHRNLCYYFPHLLRQGTFDFILAKPLNSLFYTSLRVIDFFDLTSFIPVIFLWWYIFSKFSNLLIFYNFFLYLLLLFNSLVFIFAISLLIASVNFWTITSTGIGRFFENLIKTARFPTDIFSGVLRIIFFYLIPISIITTIPTKTLLGILNFKIIIFAFCFSFVLLFISLKTWKYGLKHYSSASS